MIWTYLAGGYGVTLVAIVGFRMVTAWRQKRLREEWDALNGS